ncbi:SDR family oxidoreductase [Hellea balneolensis]|uniref:SDR family oxidoreductase n=1 Tax=Hellea balneolensis TaxID=287478 RepID=UPI00042A1A6B|nr:SDR family oxidoreductase [Hellea balneolensis]
MTDLKNVPDYVPGHGLLKGKRVVITAAAGTGIGFAASKKCIEEGARVFISDIHEGRLQKAQDTLEAETGQRPDYAICNVTVQDDVDNLISAAAKSLGGIDVVINNAGLGGTADLVDMTDEQWMSVLDVTLNGCFRVNRAAMQFMKEQGGGVIVNNASVLGWRAQKGQAHYAAAKAGVMALTRCAGVEGAEFGVRVNAVAPSLALHPFLHKVTSKELLAELETKEAYGRGSEVWEQANVMVFLASDYSSYMTGEVISTSSQRA